MFSINDNAKGFLALCQNPIIVLVIFTLLMSSTVPRLYGGKKRTSPLRYTTTRAKKFSPLF